MERLPVHGTAIGLLISNPVDARLLGEFFSELGYAVRAVPPAGSGLSEIKGSGLIIADEASAYGHFSALMQFKRDAEPVFLPALVLVKEHSPSNGWIKQGFDDVLRAPLVKAELMARLETFFRLRTASERAHVESEQRFRATFDHAPIGIAHTAPDGRLLLANDALCRMLGYEARELASLRSADITFPEDIERTARHRLTQMDRKAPPSVIEKRYVRKDGGIIWGEMLTAAVRDSNGEPKYFISLISDITARKRLEQALARSTQARRMMAQCNHVLVHAVDERELLEDMCRVAVTYGYRMAWIGMPRTDSKRTIAIVAQAADRDGYLRTRPSWEVDLASAAGPPGMAMRTGNPCVVPDVAADAWLAQWHSETGKRDLFCAIVLPLMAEEQCLGAFCIYSSERDAFGPEETELLTELAADIAYGVSAIRTRTAHARAESALLESERFAHATIDALTKHICVLDEQGSIIATNKAWRDFARDNQHQPLDVAGQSQNYLAVCDRATGGNSEEGPQVAQAIRDIIAGHRQGFTLEYPCNSPAEDRWFQVMISRFPGDGPIRIVVSHENITARKHAEEKLRESELRFRRIAENTPDATLIHQGGTIVYVNDAMLHLMHAPDASALVGLRATEIVHPEHAPMAEQRILGLYAGQKFGISEQIYLRSDGSTVEVEVAASNFLLENKPAALVTVRDITLRKAQEARIARLTRIHAVLSGINSAIVRIRNRQDLFQEACRIIVEQGGFSLGWIGVLDHETGLLTAVAQAGQTDNPVFGQGLFSGATRLTPAGAALVALRENRAAINNNIEDLPAVEGEIFDTHSVRRTAISLGARAVISLPLFTDGRTFGVLALYAPERNFFDAEEVKLLSELAGDISFGLEFIAKDERLDYLAYYDVLTGLPNRGLFFDRLSRQLGSAARVGSAVMLVLLDLDRFRQVNDTLGRQAGDGLLAAVSARISGTIRDSDTLARVGPNRFALAISDLPGSPENARGLEARNRQWFDQPFVVGGEELRISASSGVALFPDDAQNAETLFADAEAALRLAKAQRATFVFYSPEMNARVAQSLRLETRLRRVLANRELTLWYQPKFDLVTGRINGMEALMRWNDPESGMIPPAQFIPIMEQTGMILDAGNWALSQVARDCAQWMQQGVQPPRIAVNVSPIQLRQKGFVDIVTQAARDAANAGGALDLEITESMIMENVEAIIPELRVIRDMGVEIYVDDFGTGYSSLGYIAKLPIHALKIDRSFIDGMTGDAESQTIVRTVISLAHSLRLRVVAEGVEIAEQATVLGQLECDEMQGYFVSRPVPPEDVPALLRLPAIKL